MQNKLFDSQTQTTLLAVTGNPILHSKSPILFNSELLARNVDAFYFRLAADSASGAIDFVRKFNIRGFNVTMPFKQDMLSLVDYVDDSAIKIGGINTVVNNDGVLTGYNTDIYGVVNSFAEQNINVKNIPCLVIGAGGAGMAAAYGLIEAGADVTIANRTKQKAIEVARKFNCRSEGLDDIERLMRQNTIIIVSLTPGVVPFEQSMLKPHHIIFDANYKGSVINELAQQNGCRVVKAESWLLHQAIPAFEYYLGMKPNIDVMRNAIDSLSTPKIDDLKIYLTENIDIEVPNINKIYTPDNPTYKPDLVIDAKNKTKTQITNKINEEISKTFNC